MALHSSRWRTSMQAAERSFRDNAGRTRSEYPTAALRRRVWNSPEERCTLRVENVIHIENVLPPSSDSQTSSHTPQGILGSVCFHSIMIFCLDREPAVTGESTWATMPDALADLTIVSRKTLRNATAKKVLMANVSFHFVESSARLRASDNKWRLWQKDCTITFRPACPKVTPGA